MPDSQTGALNGQNNNFAKKPSTAGSTFVGRDSNKYVAYIKSYFPFLIWWPKKSWYDDIRAGVVVGVLLIPQGMSYSSLAGNTVNLYLEHFFKFHFCVF